MKTWSNEGLPVSTHLPEPGTVSDWWDMKLSDESKEARQRRSRRIIYTLWSIWKEQNRRVFNGASDNMSVTVFSVFH